MKNDRWQFINSKIQLLPEEIKTYNHAIRGLRIEMAERLKEQIENSIYHLSDSNITNRETVIKNVLSLIRGDGEDWGFEENID